MYKLSLLLRKIPDFEGESEQEEIMRAIDLQWATVIVNVLLP